MGGKQDISNHFFIFYLYFFNEHTKSYLESNQYLGIQLIHACLSVCALACAEIALLFHPQHGQGRHHDSELDRVAGSLPVQPFS